MQRRRVVLIVLDGLGIGALPDAKHYGDLGSNTLAHVAASTHSLSLPNMAQLGLSHLGQFSGMDVLSHPQGYFGKMAERSAGKDTLVGHWELCGVVTEIAFPTYAEGFPYEIIRPFEQAIGRKILGNKVASGTDIIQELGEQHMDEGRPIVYTSADSVFQVAAHEEVIPPETLYEICETARKQLKPPHQVARVIARPFTGNAACFTRTARRRDFALPPPSETLLDRLSKNGIPVIGIGKIDDIFSGKGLSKALHTLNNEDGMHQTTEAFSGLDSGLVFTNLVDFDMLYGHRNDAEGYAQALRAFDQWLPELYLKMETNDWLFITADHGNDPLFPGTDHTREYVPLLAYQKRTGERGKTQSERDLGTRKSFSDLGQTIAEIFKIPMLPVGKSFLSLME